MPMARTLCFTGPRQLDLREESIAPLGEGEVLVKTLCSGISAGSEMLIYRGQFPGGLEDHDPLSSELQYPTSYGYACVGRILETGTGVDRSWKDRVVFSFKPHTSLFTSDIKGLIPVPDRLQPDTACFLPNIETAINLVQDGGPILGEQVLVLGQGTVGLLTAALLGEFPLETLITVDPLKIRRNASSALNVTASLDPASKSFQRDLLTYAASKFDLTVELSGSPSALNDAIAMTRFSGRIIVGSWYGRSNAHIDLGSAYHRSRIKLISSQVSTISPELSGRWNKTRRFEVAWQALERIQPQKWITHRFPLEEAHYAYRMLDEEPQQSIQVIFEYPQ